MTRPLLFAGAIALSAVACATTTSAQTAPPPPAPLGVFGVDMPSKDKLVLTLAPGYAHMQGSLIGSQSVSAPYIVSNVVSPDTPAGSHLLRLVPRDVTIQTEAFSLAYGVSSNLTLVASSALLQKSVDMQAFRGLVGTNPLGFSTGRTEGFGDTTVAVVARVHQDPVNQFKLNLGLSIPTGGVTETMNLLLPNGTSPAKRAFYAMQPGGGTLDGLAGAAWSGAVNSWSLGLTYRARIPLERNSEGWRYGDLHEVNAWGGYSWVRGLETTLRLNATSQGRIEGNDVIIRGWAQGSNPAFYGGQQLSLFGGVILGGRFFGVPAAQIGMEAGAPLYQHLNGPQLGRDWQMNLAFRYRI